MEPDRSCARLKPLPLWLAPGVSVLNAWTFMLANFSVIGAVAFINVAQSYLLTAHLNLPNDVQGTVSGDLAFWNEIIIVLLAAPFGIWADRIGRRPLIVFGVVTIGVGFLMYGFATSVMDLTIARIIYAVGAAAASGMVATIGADYPQELSRGKMIGLSAVMNALGVVVLTLFLGRLPVVLQARGMDAVLAGTWMMVIAAVFCIVAGVVFRFGLKGGVPEAHSEHLSLGHLVRAGFAAMRNPRVTLAYAAAFASRGDLVVVGLFLSLWAVQAGTAAGLDPAEALKRGTVVFAISQTSALLWSPVMGWLMDKLNRVTAMTIAMGLASVGYLATAMLDSPLGPLGLPVFIVLAIGQVSALITAQGLIGQEAPRAERGAVVGMFTLWGAVGILIATSVGGRLFDAWAPYAPFVLMGGANLALFGAGIVVRLMAPGLKLHR